MYLLFDIGGTKMRLAVSKDSENFDEPKIVETPQRFEEAIETFKKLVDEVSDGEKIEMASGGVRGPFNKEKTMMINSSILSDWNNKPLKEELEKIIGATVFMENDTALVGLGEMQNGAGKGRAIGVYITVSTGVGGAKYENGVIDENKFGFEPGHQIIDLRNNKSLEDLISGTAFEEMEGKKAYESTDFAIWDQLAQYLAYGLYNTILHWSPDIVVLGGPMIVGEPSINIENVKKYLNKIKPVFPELPEIVEAELGDLGGLYGALTFLKQQKELI